MVRLLAISLLLGTLDEVSDLVEKLRKAPVAERYTLQNQITQKATKRHIPMLVSEVGKGPAIIRPYLIRALRPLDAKAELKQLTAKHDYASRAEAAYMLKLLGDDSGLRMLLEALPKVTDKDDKRAIVYKLYAFYLAGPDVVRALVDFLEKETDAYLRRIAINVLVSHKDDSIKPLLRKIASDEKNDIRYEAMAALIRLGDLDALESAMKALEDGKIPSTGLSYVVSAIQTLGDRSVLPRLRKVLETTKDTNTKTYVMRALAWLKDKKALPIIARLAEDENASVATAASDALMKLAGRSHIALIKKLTKHENAQRRLAAAEALLNMDDLSGFDVLEAELSNKTYSYRLQAVNILGSYRHPKSIDFLLIAMADADTKVSTPARQQIFNALAAMHPYMRFDQGASISTIRNWWLENRPKK